LLLFEEAIIVDGTVVFNRTQTELHSFFAQFAEFDNSHIAPTLPAGYSDMQMYTNAVAYHLYEEDDIENGASFLKIISDPNKSQFFTGNPVAQLIHSSPEFAARCFSKALDDTSFDPSRFLYYTAAYCKREELPTQLDTFVSKLTESIKGDKPKAMHLLLSSYAFLKQRSEDGKDGDHRFAIDIFSRCLKSFHDNGLIDESAHKVFTVMLSGENERGNGFLKSFNDTTFPAPEELNSNIKAQGTFMLATRDAVQKAMDYGDRKGSKILRLIVGQHKNDRSLPMFAVYVARGMVVNGKNGKSREENSRIRNELAPTVQSALEGQRIEDIFIRKDKVFIRTDCKEISVDKYGNVERCDISRGLFGGIKEKKWEPVQRQPVIPTANAPVAPRRAAVASQTPPPPQQPVIPVIPTANTPVAQGPAVAPPPLPRQVPVAPNGYTAPLPGTVPGVVYANQPQAQDRGKPPVVNDAQKSSLRRVVIPAAQAQARAQAQANANPGKPPKDQHQDKGI
jgi:hypothetical protein